MNTPLSQALVVLTGIAIGIAGCSDSDPTRGKFVAGCLHSGASKSDCLCIYEKLEEGYDSEELERLSMAYPPDDALMENTMKAALACRYQA